MRGDPQCYLRTKRMNSRLKGLGNAIGTQSGDDSMSTPSPRSHAMETLIQNSLWDTVLSYQDGVGGAKFGDGNKAARLGHFGLIRSLSKPRAIMDADADAVGGEDYEEPLMFTPAAIDGAAAKGHLELVRWLHFNRREGGTSQGLIDAAGRGHVLVVKWLLANREDNDIWRALDAAAGAHANSSSSSSSSNFRHRSDSTPSTPVVETRLSAGLCILEALLEALPAGLSDLSIRNRVALAAGAGRVDVLEWLRRTRDNVSGIGDSRSMKDILGGEGSDGSQPFVPLEYSQTAVAAAAKNGHIHVLQWLRDYGLSASDRKRSSSRHRCQAHRFQTRNHKKSENSSTSNNTAASTSSGGIAGKKLKLGDLLPFSRSRSSHRLRRHPSRGRRSYPPETDTSVGNPGDMGGGGGASSDSDNGVVGGGEGSRSNGVETPDRRLRRGDDRDLREGGGGGGGATGSLKVSAVVEDVAAAGGHLEVLRWIAEHAGPAFPQRQKGLLMGRRHQAAAAVVAPTMIVPSNIIGGGGGMSGGRGLGGRCTASAFVKACEAGLLPTTVWLAAERFNEVQSAENCLEKAARNGHLDMVKWLSGSRSWSSAGFRWAEASTGAMDEAAAGGHLEVVRWLHEHRSEGCTARAMNGAAAGGHLQTVIWLHQHRTEGCTTKAMDLAAAAGHLDTVKWLHENRSEGCTPAAMESAAENNRLETLEWLRLNRSEGWTIRAAAATARRGHLTALAYLLLGGKSEGIRRYADGFGGFAVEDDNRGADDVPGNGDDDPAAAVVDGGGGLELAAGGGVVPASTVTLNLDEAASEGRLRVLEWARWATAEEEPRGPCDPWEVFPTYVLSGRVYPRRRGRGGNCCCCCCCASLRAERSSDSSLSPREQPQQQQQQQDQEAVDVPTRFHGGNVFLLSPPSEQQASLLRQQHRSVFSDAASDEDEPQRGNKRVCPSKGSRYCGACNGGDRPLEKDILRAAAELDTDYAGWRRFFKPGEGSSVSLERKQGAGGGREVGGTMRGGVVGKNRFRVVVSSAGVDGAAANGHLEVVRWLYYHRSEGGTSRAVESAAANGHVRVVDWLNRNTRLRATLRGSILKPSALELSAASGHLEVIRWFHRHTGKEDGDPECFDSFSGFTYRVMDEAAANGHLQVCWWLYRHRREGCSWNAFDGAAAGGHTHVLDWLAQKFGRVGPSAVAFPKAANAGHLHVVDWLERHYPREVDAGCVWALLELSENSPFESVRAKRHGAMDVEMLELVKRRVALSSGSGIRRCILGTETGVACVPGKGIYCTIA